MLLFVYCALQIIWFIMCIGRYVEGSTTEATRCGRDKAVSRIYTVRNSIRLPPQKVILNVTKNKIQLIYLIVTDLIAHTTDFQTHTFVVVGSNPVPVDIEGLCPETPWPYYNTLGSRYNNYLTCPTS